MDVYDLGIVPTPVLQYALTQLGAQGGISISGPSVSAERKAFHNIMMPYHRTSPISAEELNNRIAEEAGLPLKSYP